VVPRVAPERGAGPRGSTGALPDKSNDRYGGGIRADPSRLTIGRPGHSLSMTTLGSYKEGGIMRNLPACLPACLPA